MHEEKSMNDLEKYFYNNDGPLIFKWLHYFDIYDHYFARYRGTDVHLLEFGVLHGGSLKMWKNYFGPKAKIYGFDINPHCKKMEENQIEIFIGNQEDKTDLKRLVDAIPRIDILIDDGGHSPTQQINTFEVLFPHIDSHGIFVCEDLHSSYLKGYQGGYKKKGTFIEYSKDFIDYIHAWHFEQQRNLYLSDFAQTVYALHYYDSMLVIEKKPRGKPVAKATGHKCVADRAPMSFMEKIRGKFTVLKHNWTYKE